MNRTHTGPEKAFLIVSSLGSSKVKKKKICIVMTKIEVFTRIHVKYSVRGFMIIHIPEFLRKERTKSKLNRTAIILTTVINTCRTMTEFNRLAEI